MNAGQRRYLKRTFKDTGIVILMIIGVVLLLAAIIAYSVFQWGECRKDPDHTFWHCVQVMDS